MFRHPDTNPPHEVGNIPTPTDGSGDVPLADTIGGLSIQSTPKQSRPQDRAITMPGRLCNRADNVFGNLMIGFITINKWLPQF